MADTTFSESLYLDACFIQSDIFCKPKTKILLLDISPLVGHQFAEVNRNLSPESTLPALETWRRLKIGQTTFQQTNKYIFRVCIFTILA